MEPQGIPFRTILENMAEAVLLCARPGCILHLNPAAERFLEQPRDRAIERSCFELFGDDPAGPRPDCPADLARGEGVGHLSLERTITTPSGKTKDVLLRCIPCSDANQPELSHILIIEDLTALKQSETSARETESRYRSFVENFLGIAYRSRMDWIPVFFHGSVEEITGYLERDFLEGRPRWDQVILPEDLESLEGRDELPAVPGYMVDRTASWPATSSTHPASPPFSRARSTTSPSAWRSTSSYARPRNSRAWASSRAGSHTTSTTCSWACSATRTSP
jgi:PAS domain S-box-containing protein